MAVNLKDEISGFLCCCQEKALTKNSIIAYRSNLKGFQIFAEQAEPEQPLSDKAVARYIEYIEKNFSPGTVERRISTLRVFMDYMVSCGKIPENCVRNVKSPISKFYVSVPCDLLEKSKKMGLDCNDLLISALKKELGL